ncbi:MAG: PQQ-like beta-propeller repeat protein [Acidobacteria bacterium]|nr:PQQ-like beta-propeller repeat protein [Acidobacteriota bacterium]
MAAANHGWTAAARAMLVTVCTTAAAVALTGSAAAQDWAQWRGPQRDGTVSGFDVPATWPEGLTAQWTREVGLGYATPLLIGERLYLFTREGNEEVMQALDAASGETIWRSAYSAAFEMNPATNPHGPGPKSTPAYADGRLFTFGISGIVSAFDAATGERLWHKPAGPVEPLYHTAMSPLVVGNLVILHVGGHDAGALTAFDAATGDVRWALEGDGPAYGSPQLYEIGGTRQVVTLTQTRYIGVSVETGALLWERSFTTPYDTTSQTPLRHGDIVIQTGMEVGITGFRVTPADGGWTTEDVWHTDEVTLHMTNGVIADGVLVGLSQRNSGQYFGLDLDTGEVLWTSPPRQAENAAILRSGETILSLQDDAQLVVLRHGRTEFDPIARYDVADSSTWTQPTLAGNRLYVKDIDTLTLWTVE